MGTDPAPAPKKKWASLLPPETPLGEAAREILSARLKTVREHLQPAAEKAHEDVEHVHQLRVATRRAAAAVRVFDDVIPEKKARRARALLRSVRRAAGDARDWDVFAGILDESKTLAGPVGPPARDFLLGYAQGHRSVAQLLLQQVAADRSDELTALIDDLPINLEAQALTLAPKATVAMADLFETFNAILAGRPKTDNELHQLRIHGKRTRYAMEIFAGCYAPAFHEVLYPAVEDVQGLLGTIQDGNVLAARIADVRTWLRASRPATLRRFRPGFDGLARESSATVRAARTAYRGWTRTWVKLSREHPLGRLTL